MFLLAGAPAAGVEEPRLRFSVWTGAPECHLEDLFVAPSERGRGLGRALLRRAMELAHERGATSMDLATGEGDAAARALYESEGFLNFEPHSRDPTRAALLRPRPVSRSGQPGSTGGRRVGENARVGSRTSTERRAYPLLDRGRSGREGRAPPGIGTALLEARTR